MGDRPASKPLDYAGLKANASGDRWSAIVDAALEVFAEKGYQAASVQDIAARVGLLKGSLYYYMSSKEDLLFAICQRAYQRTADVIVGDEGLKTGCAMDRLCRFVDLWDEQLETQYDATRVGTEVRYLSDGHKREIRSLSVKVENRLAEIIEAGIAEGSFSPRVDPALAVVSVIRLVHNYGSHRVDPDMALRIREWNKEFILRGLGCAQ
jgi:AcrR family transcriptional regulator